MEVSNSPVFQEYFVKVIPYFIEAIPFTHPHVQWAGYDSDANRWVDWKPSGSRMTQFLQLGACGEREAMRPFTGKFLETRRNR
jgi:hypothetical protein